MYKIYYKKSLGQHYLKSNYIARKIVDSLSYNNYNTVVEVGSGFGILSKYLINTCNNLFLIEIDTYLVNKLKKKFPILNNRIINENFLLWNHKSLDIKKFALIGNFPYNISSKIIYKLFLINNYIPECIGMFQKEFYNKISSNYGNKLYCILSVLIQTFYKIEYLFSVEKKYFYPKPSVKSCVIRFLKKDNIPNFDNMLYLIIIKNIFNKRRKTLRNALKYLFKKDISLYDLLILNINHLSYLDKHIEEISIDKFIELTYCISKLNIKNFF